MLHRTFMTALGKFLPGEPVGNDQMERRLGQIGSTPSRVRERVLRQNKIDQRYYAIDDRQRSVYSNAQMAAHAVCDAISKTSLDLKEIPLLVAATSQGDLPLGS